MDVVRRDTEPASSVEELAASLTAFGAVLKANSVAAQEANDALLRFVKLVPPEIWVAFEERARAIDRRRYWQCFGVWMLFVAAVLLISL